MARSFTENTDAWAAIAESKTMEIRDPDTKALLWVSKDRKPEDRKYWFTLSRGEKALRRIIIEEGMAEPDTQDLRACGRAKAHFYKGKGFGGITKHSEESMWKTLVLAAIKHSITPKRMDDMVKTINDEDVARYGG